MGSMSRILMELSNNKRTATSIEKWRRDMNRQYIEVKILKQIFLFLCLFNTGEYVEEKIQGQHSQKGLFQEY